MAILRRIEESIKIAILSNISLYLWNAYDSLTYLDKKFLNLNKISEIICV